MNTWAQIVGAFAEPPKTAKTSSAPQPPVTEKACTKCGTVKPLSEFYPRNNRSGVTARCKRCVIDATSALIKRQQQARKLSLATFEEVA